MRILPYLLCFLSFMGNAKDIAVRHMPDGNKCILCHRPEKPKELLLRNGTKISLSEVNQLCGQCHSTKFNRWIEGRHGKVIGGWTSEKRERVSCIKCHDPHSPKFPSFEAKPPPVIRGKDHGKRH